MMMLSKFKLATIAMLFLLDATCKKEELAGIPDCILKKIEVMSKEKVSNPPSSVYQYEYNGQTVYFIPQICCDIPSILYDKDCNVICNPDGGFSGKGDGKCSDFFQKRTNEKLIWKDERQR